MRIYEEMKASQKVYGQLADGPTRRPQLAEV